MKFLLDMPVSHSLIDVLVNSGHEGVHAFTIGKATASDNEIISIARNEERIIVTADLDFPRILALSGKSSPGIILFRGGNYSDKEMKHLLVRVLENVKPEILIRSICVVDKYRVRITRLPLKRK